MSRIPRVFLLAAALLAAILPAAAQEPKQNPTAPRTAPDSAAKKDADPDAELQKALAAAGNDSAAIVRNLTDYLARFPDAPRRASIYRALVEACQQIRNDSCSLEYTERLVALHPDDSQMMLLAASLLEKKGDDASLVRAAGYVTRVLDRVEKTTPDDKPSDESLVDFRDGQAQLRSALYYTRGRIENSQKDDAAAEKDFRESASAHANALASEKLGEIAETRNDLKTAIDDYTEAFALPASGPAGTVDRRDLRRKLGNVWRQVHGSEQGLGDAILAAYDRTARATANPAPSAAARNKDAKDFFAFVLRGLDGKEVPLARFKGKAVVVSFWATWCGPCRALEPLFGQVAKNYAGNSSVVFLSVNTDDDETQVLPFVAREELTLPVFFADGLQGFMKVDTLPTVLILNRSGEIVYRIGDLAPEGFSASLTAAIERALGAPQ